MIVDSGTFESWIVAAVNAVPATIRRRVENVAFVVDAETDGRLLGLYQGVPLPRRGPHYTGVLPDKITIFQQTIENHAGLNPENIKRLTTEVVHHEIAHYLGLDEAEVRRWEQRRRAGK